MEWLLQAAQQSQRYVVKIAGAIQCQPRIVRAVVEQLVRGTLEPIESGKGTGYPNAWAPVSERYHAWIVKTPRTALGHDAAVEIENAHAHGCWILPVRSAAI